MTLFGKYRPTLVLSSKSYNQQTGLLICCPISTSIRGGATEVLINNLEQPSVVAAYEKIPTFCRNCVRLNDKP